MKSTVIFEGPVNVPVKAKSGCLGCTFHVSYPITIISEDDHEFVGYQDICCLIRDKEGRHVVSDEIDCPVTVSMTEWGKEP